MSKKEQKDWVEEWRENLIVLKKTSKNDFDNDADQLKFAIKNMLRFNYLFNKNFKKDTL